MDAELKAKWVAALRSGEYKQALSTLRSSNEQGDFGYCCLGVLADICGAEWVKQEQADHIFRPMIDGVHADWNEMGTYLSNEFAVKCGLQTYEPKRGNVQRKLANLNDGIDNDTGCEPQNFSQIADYIEKNL